VSMAKFYILGIVAIHAMTLTILRFYEEELCNLSDSCDAFKFLADLPKRIREDEKIKFDFNSHNLKENALIQARKKIGDLTDLKKSKKMLLKKEDLKEEENNFTDLLPHLKQAEVVLSIRAAVDEVCRHFGKDINVFLDYEGKKDIVEIKKKTPGIKGRCKALKRCNSKDG
jgi:hypothetical protein